VSTAATYKADELAFFYISHEVEGDRGSMTGRSKVDRMINGNLLLPPSDCRASRVGTYVRSQSVSHNNTT
jgi:hypothetical protein